MKKYLIFCASIVFLGGCAIFQPTPPPLTLTPEQKQNLLTRQALLSQVTDWNLLGRLSIRTEDDAWTGKLRWQQSVNDFRIHFNAPFGQGAMQLMSNPQFGVEMKIADGQTFYADNAESLLYNHTGWELPVSGLKQWIVGIPGSNDITKIKFDTAGRLAMLGQADWQIEYLGYKKIDEIDLPRKIVLQNDQLTIRLVIDQWMLKI